MSNSQCNDTSELIKQLRSTIGSLSLSIENLEQSIKTQCDLATDEIDLSKIFFLIKIF